MGRPTQSYGLFVQQFGRVLRTADDKTHGTVIDHVGNVVRHGLPDAPRQWSLEAPEGNRKGSSDPDTIGLEGLYRVLPPIRAAQDRLPRTAVQYRSRRGAANPRWLTGISSR